MLINNILYLLLISLNISSLLRQRAKVYMQFRPLCTDIPILFEVMKWKIAEKCKFLLFVIVNIYLLIFIHYSLKHLYIPYNEKMEDK